MGNFKVNSITRTLCQKYTDLNDEEITHIEEYAKMLQPLANAEQADVFIDCVSRTGKTAIVVGEAKPQTVSSNYSIPILGMLINWADEPAVDRTFRFGKPTKKMCAVHMPEDRKVIQTVEPLFYEGKLIAVLIYEKNAETVEGIRMGEEDAIDDFFSPMVKTIFENLEEAIILIGKDDSVVACNKAAKELYSEKLGYVDDILGMSLRNIQTGSDEMFFPETSSNGSISRHEERVSAYHLKYTTIPMNDEKIKLAILINDITQLQNQKEKVEEQSVAMREQRHRLKNSLMLLSGMLKEKEKYSDEHESISVLSDTAGRLDALASTLDEIVHVSDKTASLKYVLEKVRSSVLQSSIGTFQPVSIKIETEDQAIKSAYASPIALVVNELLQNAIKHAFPSGKSGMVSIKTEQGILSPKILVSDNGVGFNTETLTRNGTGLDIVATIVKEKLNGEFSIVSNQNGTTVSFDFI